jgi:NAD-dependent deacetylase
MNSINVKPNITHKYLKKLEDSGKLKAIITQNIDGLHTKAGNKNVYEIHGTIYKNYCLNCNKEYDANYVFKSNGIPKCKCGGLIKPNVVLYGEMLPEDEYMNSLKAISNADMLLVLGTSLTVYPASSMINYFKGKYLVIINKDKTEYDYKADLVINKKLSEVFNKLDINF